MEKEISREEWREKKKQKRAQMQAMQALPYEVKIKRAEMRAREFVEKLDDMELLRSMLREENDQLSEYLKVDKVEKLPEDMIRKKKLMVGALASMLSELEIDAELEAAVPEQPELPQMKNNEQRKKWLRSYHDWGLWYEDTNIGAKYYKYDFENGARLIAETYVISANKYCPEHETCYLHLVGGPEPPKHSKYGVGKWTRHDRYNRYQDSETELMEFLKAVQKN